MRNAVRRRRAALRARQEDGWALLISLIVMVVMFGFGMAIVSVADTQSKLGATTRQRDAAFQLADGALNATEFALGNSWPGPGAAANPFPTCTPSQTDTRCPSPTLLTNLINNADTASNVSWQINVYDNGVNAQGQSMQSFYSDAYASGQANYDANGDGKLWIRAQATVGNVTKTVVALVQSNPVNTPLPHAVIIAGNLQTTNNGNKTIIDTQGNPGPPPGIVYVRCNPLTDPNCLVYDPTKNQISPDTTSGNYAGGTSLLNATVQAGLKAEAMANGTYYATCPASAPSGAVVWIDSGNCSWTGNAQLNSAQQPGLMVINNGTITLAGTLSYYGLVYALNAQATSGAVVTTGGNAQITGAVFVDGNGGVGAGSSKLNVTFDANALNTVNTIGNVSYIQSTWREL
jgi:Tfp pilus assembly protein PilX